MGEGPAPLERTGGCQCGAVRYVVKGTPTGASICHCRMCQKAGGAPFMAYAGVREGDFEISRGRIATFRSSDIAERGFCSECGTPALQMGKSRRPILNSYSRRGLRGVKGLQKAAGTQFETRARLQTYCITHGLARARRPREFSSG